MHLLQLPAHVVVVAIGVTPAITPGFFKGQAPIFADDGGICVDSRMQSSVECVLAAGDCSTVNQAHSLHWFQMRLWEQASVMGAYQIQSCRRCLNRVLRILAGAAAARTMLTHALGRVDDIEAQAPFELFAHVTKFLGWRVTMLGLFNGQGLNAAECEAIVRVTKGVE